MGDRFGSSKAYEPSSFFLILYTINITTNMAHKSPTTAPPITAATKNKSVKVLKPRPHEASTSEDAGLREERSRPILRFRIHVNEHLVFVVDSCSFRIGILRRQL